MCYSYKCDRSKSPSSFFYSYFVSLLNHRFKGFIFSVRVLRWVYYAQKTYKISIQRRPKWSPHIFCKCISAELFTSHFFHPYQKKSINQSWRKMHSLGFYILHHSHFMNSKWWQKKRNDVMKPIDIFIIWYNNFV